MAAAARAKARTGKSKARIDEAGRLMRELDDLETRSAKGIAQIDFTATDRRTKRLVSVEKISKELGGKPLFRNLSFTLMPGTRLGLLGLNGTGKTTLELRDHRLANCSLTPAAWSSRNRCGRSTSIRLGSIWISARLSARASAPMAIT